MNRRAHKPPLTGLTASDRECGSEWECGTAWPCGAGGLAGDGADGVDVGVAPPEEEGVYGLAGLELELGLELPWGWCGP